MKIQKCPKCGNEIAISLDTDIDRECLPCAVCSATTVAIGEGVLQHPLSRDRLSEGILRGGVIGNKPCPLQTWVFPCAANTKVLA